MLNSCTTYFFPSLLFLGKTKLVWLPLVQFFNELDCQHLMSCWFFMQCFLLWYWMFDGVLVYLKWKTVLTLVNPNGTSPITLAGPDTFSQPRTPWTYSSLRLAWKTRSSWLSHTKRYVTNLQVTYFPILSALVKTFQFVYYRVRKVVPRLKSYGTPNTWPIPPTIRTRGRKCY